MALVALGQKLLHLLGTEAFQEFARIWDITDDLQKLTETISNIEAGLRNVEDDTSHSPKTHQDQLWLKQIRQVYYDADDILDDFWTEVLRLQRATSTPNQISMEVRSFFSKSNQLLYGWTISKGIRDIGVVLDEITKRKRMFHFEVPPVEYVGRDHSDSSVPEMVVGREDDKSRILHLLFQTSEDEVSVFPVVGIGGLGKTVLAQLVFNDEKVKSFFERRIWVSVSHSFDVSLVMENIIESCTGLKLEKGFQMDTLRKRLQNEVNGKKYLIVLDDVWNEDWEKWHHLRSSLKGGATGSRIMITTRSNKVAKLVSRMNPYELKALNESDSWNLFRDMAFQRGQVGNGTLELIGREILLKCKGVPLAIKTIAGALYFKKTESEWTAFKNTDVWKMKQKESEIMPTLKLSYDHLPTHLKYCFAYCGLFPRDSRLKVKTLIQLWIAQGYVKNSTLDSLDLFDIGLEYFMELLWGSFFQDVVKDEYGNIVSCKMHHLMHDLALVVAGEETLTLDISKQPNKQSHEVDLKRTRHVSLDFDCSSFNRQLLKSRWTSMMNDANRLRTLLCSKQEWLEDKKVFDEITFNRTSLRALDLSHFGLVRVSSTIQKLKHIRFLNLSNNPMELLPDEITELVNLEVLQLDNCIFMKHLPKNTGKLSSLTHLGLDGCKDLKCLPLGIGKLICLLELPVFLVPEGGGTGAAGIGEIQNLNQLRGSLKIENLQWVKNPSEASKASLCDKLHLEQLKLSWAMDKANSDVDIEDQVLDALRPHPDLKVLWLHNHGGLKFPSWFPHLTGLVTIQIVNANKWECLSPLDGLPFLEKLELLRLESLEWIDIDSLASFFPSLKSLKIERCDKLKGWRAPAGKPVPTFPCVSAVHIDGCSNIVSLPLFSPLHLDTVSLLKVRKKFLNLILSPPPSVSLPSSTSPPYFHLEDLRICSMYDLDTLPEEILACLSSVKMLSIMDCANLVTLDRALPYLTSLEMIKIADCDKLDLLYTYDTSADQLSLQNLHAVEFHNIAKLTCLPEWLQVAPNLEKIMTALCPIGSIPIWMHTLKELKGLIILQYGKSAEQFVQEDLEKIAHVPYVTINAFCIRMEGQFKINWAQTNDIVVDGEAEQVEERSRLVQFLNNVCNNLTAFSLGCFGSGSSNGNDMPGSSSSNGNDMPGSSSSNDNDMQHTADQIV